MSEVQSPSWRKKGSTASGLDVMVMQSPLSWLEVICTASRLEMRVHSLEAKGEGCTAARLEVREVQKQTRRVGDAATRLDAREVQPLGKARCKELQPRRPELWVVQGKRC